MNMPGCNVAPGIFFGEAEPLQALDLERFDLFLNRSGKCPRLTTGSISDLNKLDLVVKH